jgi:hypothetical protein
LETSDELNCNISELIFTPIQVHYDFNLKQPNIIDESKTKIQQMELVHAGIDVKRKIKMTLSPSFKKF